MWTPEPDKEFKYAARVATSVFPSPVRISEMFPWCNTMPPINCTSKWRIFKTRLPASLTSANASGKISSKLSPALILFLYSFVLLGKSLSFSNLMSFSSKFIFFTILLNRPITRSFRLPNSFLKNFIIIVI